jgi:hypothetical protein
MVLTVAALSVIRRDIDLLSNVWTFDKEEEKEEEEEDSHY